MKQPLFVSLFMTLTFGRGGVSSSSYLLATGKSSLMVRSSSSSSSSSLHCRHLSAFAWRHQDVNCRGSCRRRHSHGGLSSSAFLPTSLGGGGGLGGGHGGIAGIAGGAIGLAGGGTTFNKIKPGGMTRTALVRLAAAGGRPGPEAAYSGGGGSKDDSDKDKDDDDDPWAGHRIHVDDDDDDTDNASSQIDEEMQEWISKLPEDRRDLLRDLETHEPDMSAVLENLRRTGLGSDHFYDPFDEDKFDKIQRDYRESIQKTKTSATTTTTTNGNVGNTARDADTSRDETGKTRDPRDATSPYTNRNDDIGGPLRDRPGKTSPEEHLRHQRSSFDERAEYFNTEEATPDAVRPILKHLTRRFLGQMLESRKEGIDRRNKRSRKKQLSVADKAEQQNRDRQQQDRHQQQQQRGNDDTNRGETMPEIFRVLDVGCGTGALFPFLLRAADEMDMRLNITGVDLSGRMTEYAGINAENALDDAGGRHEINVICDDFCSLILGDNYHERGGGAGGGPCGDGEENEETRRFRGQFDAVIINACFENFFDQNAAMTAAAQSLSLDGIVCITHPLGGDFVRKLNAEDPESVPHFLPTILDFRDLARTQPLNVLDFAEQVDLLDKDKKVKSHYMYYASASRTPHRALPKLIRLRGPVDKGYGRGGKKVGFPTANLPASLFSDALEDISTGVYFGWAVIEDMTGMTKKGRNTWHKAVVNVGYSPTFEGNENREKIVEAHLILDSGDSISDFYNETMRLQLSGFLRPEKKFPSFNDLMSAIEYDVQCASDALSMQPFAALRTDTFLVDPCRRVNNTMIEKGVVWTGKDGGDRTASWEFQDIKEAILATPLGRWAA